MATTEHRTLDTGHSGGRIGPPGERRTRGRLFRGLDDAPAASKGLGDQNSPRVLIVDDDPASRMLCSINLEIEGVAVLEAADGRRGLEQARSERPDVVVTDVMMPGLDGFQLAEALRSDERTRRIPLIFISAETGSAAAARATELGALAYLTKPFDPTTLASLVTGVVCARKRDQPAAPAAAARVVASHPAP